MWEEPKKIRQCEKSNQIKHNQKEYVKKFYSKIGQKVNHRKGK